MCVASSWHASLTCHGINDSTTPGQNGGKNKSIFAGAAPPMTLIGCIGAPNPTAIMGACSFQTSRITFESSRQFHLDVDCVHGSPSRTAALDSGFTARMTRRVITLPLTKAPCCAIGRGGTNIKQDQRRQRTEMRRKYRETAGLPRAR